MDSSTKKVINDFWECAGQGFYRRGDMTGIEKRLDTLNSILSKFLEIEIKRNERNVMEAKDCE